MGIITTRTLAGNRRDGRDRGRGQVDALTRDGMLQVVSHAEASRTLAGLRDSAMIRLMSDCLLRISETVAVNIEDVGHTLTIRSSKTDQEGKGESLFIGEPTHNAINKVLRRRRNRVRRAIPQDTPRATYHFGTPLGRECPSDYQEVGEAAGIEGFISGHSLRVGTAVSLAQSGATLVDMQTAGRWDDLKMPAHYAKAELAERGAVARFFYGK